MTHNGYPTGDASPSPQTNEVAPDVLELVLQPDEPLAAQFLDRSIVAAEADPQTDQEALELLRFQRSFVDMTEGKAYSAAQDFARRTGKYASFTHTFGKSTPDLHYPLNRELVVADSANAERWRIVGIDPSQYGDSPYAHSYTGHIEESWREARKARQALQTAQVAEAKAMERASHPPVYEPSVVA